MDNEPGALPAVIGSALSYAAGLGFLGFVLQSQHVPEEGGGFVDALLRVGQDAMPLPLAGAIIGAVGGGIHGWMRHQRDHELWMKFQVAARALGAEYVALDTALGGMLRPYFTEADSVTCSNLLRLGREDMNLVIVDVKATTATGGRTASGRGRRVRSVVQTVAFLNAAGAPLPEFVVQPGGTLLNGASRLLGAKDIDFPSHPGFSKQYNVTSMDETGLRRILTPLVLTALENARGITLEGRREGVVLYRRGVVVDPDRLGPFARSAKSILPQVIGASRAAG